MLRRTATVECIGLPLKGLTDTAALGKKSASDPTGLYSLRASYHTRPGFCGDEASASQPTAELCASSTISEQPQPPPAKRVRPLAVRSPQEDDFEIVSPWIWCPKPLRKQLKLLDFATRWQHLCAHSPSTMNPWGVALQPLDPATTDCYARCRKCNLHAMCKYVPRFCATVELASPPAASPALTHAVVVRTKIPKLTPENRLLRKFGDRVLEVIFTHLTFPVVRSVVHALVAPTQKPLLLKLAGREYSFVGFVPCGREQRSGTDGKKEKSVRVTFIAVHGPGLDPLPVDIIKDLLPPEWNKEVTLLKFVARHQLSTSCTVAGASYAFEPVILPDVVSPIGSNMTDGAAPISPGLLRYLLAPADRVCPYACAYQARFGGFKGLWIVDDAYPSQFFFARVSQVKYVTSGEMETRLAYAKQNTEKEVRDKYCQSDQLIASPASEHLRTFEIVHDSGGKVKPCALNRQAIALLECRGVPANTFVKLAEAYVGTLDAEILNGCRGVDPHGKERIRFERWNEESLEGMLYAMLQTGFSDKEPYAHRLLLNIKCGIIKKLKTKCRIPTQPSAELFIVPDTRNVLRPGTCSIHLTQDDGRVHGVQGEVVIYKNPCFLPSDVLKLTAVDAPELASWRDVLVFPTTVTFARAICTLTHAG
eukprot:TRINITY_DN2032_c0_g1_i12.p1 TRINITY_DN2032_c0_g1~~TRINITY_DN2032_c0_g1_i12.p1  ORF type:complete len:650 (-),score=106.86 TRINITY_DN2032_c0_g1_i12:1824-3773(-)